MAASLGQHREAREDRLDPLARAAGLEIAAHLEILAHAQRREDVVLLRHEGDAERADLARRAARIAASSRRTRPRLGASTPAMTFSSVDLPAPLGPMMLDDLARPTLEIDALEDLVGGR